MSKIRIKNFGPIREGFNTDDGFMDIKKVTVFIGDQGTGKSAVAKLISTLSWMEKSLNRGDIHYFDGNNFSRFKEFVKYQGIEDYFLPNTEIEYIGEAYSFELGKPPIIKETKGNYRVPKIMYVPAERNFLSTIQNAYDVTNLPKPLFTFGEELIRAQRNVDASGISLPISKFRYQYDSSTNTSFVSGIDHRINLLYASSGLQSAIPLFLVARNLAYGVGSINGDSSIVLSLNQAARRNEEIVAAMQDASLEENERKNKIENIYSKYHNTCFINIVEEPEQNLFPTSQRNILNSLLELANHNDGNKLIMTTHSPYIINYLSIAIQGEYLKQKIYPELGRKHLFDRLCAVVPYKSTIAANEVAIYQLQKDGSINLLPNYEGIPSDKNYLNNSLAEGNELFDTLLEIEQEL